MASLGSSALWYAEHGVPVFPLKPGTKRPANVHGVTDATTDPAQIRGWWGRQPAANIGAATGYVFDAIDIDGPEGQASRAERWCYDPACRAAGRLPQPPAWWTETCDHPGVFNRVEAVQLGKVLTPRPGGMHIYVPPGYAHDRNAARIYPGVDYRGRGGYVVAPPSVISPEWAAAEGQTAGSYVFLGLPMLEPVPAGEAG